MEGLNHSRWEFNRSWWRCLPNVIHHFFSRFLCFWVWMADGEKLFEKLNFSLKEDEEANPCQMECVFLFIYFFIFIGKLK